MQAATWIVPDAQRVPTRKAYFPPDSRIHPVDAIVIHYTAGADVPLKPRVKTWAEQPIEVNDASTHLVTSRRPIEQPTLQLAPLEARTWHAGGSIFNGVEGVNRFSIGVDFDNVGFLHKSGGTVLDAYGRTYHGPAPFVAEDGELWEPYTEEAVIEVCRIVLMIVDLCDTLHGRPDRITGHENIRSTKRDPGHAFDQFWPVLRNVMNGVFPTGLTHI